MPEEQLSARRLCEIDDVRALIPGVTERNTEVEKLIVREINAESGRMHRRARREFKPRAENPQTRRFDLSSFDQAERSVPIGDLANSTSLVVTIEDQTGATLETVPATGYVLLPRDGDREPTEPYGEIWFPPSATGTATYLSVGNVLKLIGNFGYPEIPDELRDECAHNCATKVTRRLPLTQQADEDASNQQLRRTYRVTDSHRAPRG